LAIIVQTIQCTTAAFLSSVSHSRVPLSGGVKQAIFEKTVLDTAKVTAND